MIWGVGKGVVGPVFSLLLSLFGLRSLLLATPNSLPLLFLFLFFLLAAGLVPQTHRHAHTHIEYIEKSDFGVGWVGGWVGGITPPSSHPLLSSLFFFLI